MSDEINNMLSDSNESKKDEKKVSDKKEPNKLMSLLKELRREFAKIIWPSRPELVEQTITVISVSILVGIVIFGMDSVFNALYTIISGLLTSKG